MFVGKTVQLKGKHIQYHDMVSVFEELCRIEYLVEGSPDVDQKNNIVTRLKALIEQFFRSIMEFLFSRRFSDYETITMRLEMLDDISDISRNYKFLDMKRILVSQALPFHNTKDIMQATKPYGLCVFIDKSHQRFNATSLVKQDYDEFFETRNNVAHTIDKRPYLDVRKYYNMTEKLLDHVLERVKYYEFYKERRDALSRFGKSGADKYDKNIVSLKDAAQIEGKTATDLFIKHEYEKSITHCKKALNLDPLDFASQFTKSHAYFYLSQYDNAAQSFRRYVEISYDESGVSLYRGLTFYKLNNHEAAIDCLMKAMERKSDRTEAGIYLAVSLGLVGSLDEVLKSIEKVLQDDPRNKAALYIKKLTQDEIKRRKK